MVEPNQDRRPTVALSKQQVAKTLLFFDRCSNVKVFSAKMYHSNIILMEIAHEFDVAEARAKAKRENISDRIRRNAFKMTERLFIKRYRLSKALTRELIREITPFMLPTVRSDALDVETKVLVALSFFAKGSYQTDVGDNRRHCIAQSSVSKAIKQVTLALNKPQIINKYICFPFTPEERQQVKREFYKRFKMPGCLGCIDGTHVAIVCPNEHEERFFNRKNYHSLNVQLICDANMNILNVDASYPGATHDSVIWANHKLNEYLERLHTVSGEDLYILGDSGYPLRPIMMIPLTDPEPDSPEENYQNKHLSTRNTVERCIGVLKGRFRCLLVDRKLHYTPMVAARIVNACCVLHNIANRHNLPFEPLSQAEAARERERTEGVSGSMPAARGVLALSQLELGRSRRQALINRLWTNRAVEN